MGAVCEVLVEAAARQSRRAVLPERQLLRGGAEGVGRGGAARRGGRECRRLEKRCAQGQRESWGVLSLGGPERGGRRREARALKLQDVSSASRGSLSSRSEPSGLPVRETSQAC